MNDAIGILILLSIPGGILALIGGFVWMCKREAAQAQAKYEAEKALEEVWLAEEKRKPKAVLKVLIKDEDGDIEVFSDPFEPEYERGGYRTRKWYRYSSEDMANREAHAIAKGDYFKKGKQRWPHQVITKVTVVMDPKG